VRNVRYQPVQRDFPALVILLVASIVIAVLGKTEYTDYVSEGLARVFLPFESLSVRVMNISYTYEENRILRGRLMEVSRDNMALREHVAEIRRLRALLGFSAECSALCTPARVLGEADPREGGGIKIDRGTESQIDRDMVVISPDGLVGRVVEADRGYSRVKRLTDTGSKVSAMLSRTRSGGILRTRVGGRLFMEWVPPKADVVPGDTVISSGYGLVIPKGIPIGEVKAVYERPTEFSLSLEVEPFVDFNRLEEVFVLVPAPGSSAPGSRYLERKELTD
jgi:rod shape-determining protein MreC